MASELVERTVGLAKGGTILTLWALAEGHLLDAGVVAAGGHLQLALVLVELAVRAAHGFAVVAAVPVAGAALETLLLWAAHHTVARAALRKALWERSHQEEIITLVCKHLIS